MEKNGYDEKREEVKEETDAPSEGADADPGDETERAEK